MEQGRDSAGGREESHRHSTSGLKDVVWEGVGSEVAEAVVVYAACGVEKSFTREDDGYTVEV